MDDATLALAKELIQRPSVTPEDRGCQLLIAERLAGLGFDIEHMRFDDVDNLWARRGDESPLFVFAGHTDVVTPGEITAWSHDPFTPTVEGGLLYGRGSADMKGSIAAFVIAVEEFVKRYPKHTGSIALLLTSDEEGPAQNGTVKVIQELQRRKQVIDYCVVGEPTSETQTGDTIKHGRRGSLHAHVTVHGSQGHVAYPHLASNPVHNIAPALQELVTTVWDSGDRDFPPTSFQITDLHAGTGASNVIPGKLDLRLNFRFSPAVTPQQLKSRVQSTFDKHELHYDIDWTLSGVPYLTTNGVLIEATKQAIREQLAVEPRLSTSGGTSDGRFIAPTGAQVIEVGLTNATIHKVDERVAVEDPERLSRVYFSVLEKLLR